MKFLSYGVMCYMLLALIWWTVLLSKNNETIYTKNIEIVEMSQTDQAEQIEIITKQYYRNKYMILGEGMVFGISLIIGMWFIQKAYNKEIQNTQNQKNFLLSITHELKSPIAAINLTTETLMKRKILEEKKNELYESILTESNRLEKLINNLLMATKIETGYAYNFETCHLNTIISNCVARINNNYPETSITFKEDVNPLIMADYESIVSIFTNLFENSIKYSDQEPVISISTQEMAKDWCIKVTDNSIGISDKEKALVFDKFYRTGNEETRKTKGTGLGLYIVNKIVRAHRGTIQISDNPKGGAIFTITLPKIN